jgi:hypothetical protein
VLEAPEFSTTREVEYWWPKSSDAEESEIEIEAPSGFWLGMARLFAALLRYGAFIALAIVLGWLLLQIARSRAAAAARGSRVAASTDEARLGSVSADAPLPEDPVAAARALWLRGDPTGALSLLYRSALAHLVRELGLELPQGATEGECERLASRGSDAQLANDFSALSRAWQHAAYAEQPPAESAFLALCDAWAVRLEALA